MIAEDVLRGWLVAQCEPLLSPADRGEIESQMQMLAKKESEIFKIFFAGLLSDLVLSLDPQDPWRRLSVNEAGQVLNVRGQAFGTLADSSDVLHQTNKNPLLDAGFAAFAQSLDPACSQLIEAAGKGQNDVYTELGILEMTGFALGETLPSLRWVMHRRRVFSGQEDPYVILSGDAWIDIATTGSQPDLAHLNLLRESLEVAPGTWREYCRTDWSETS